MSGHGQVSIQPSAFNPHSTQAGTFVRGVPIPGVRDSGGSLEIPAVDGIASCADLFSSSPPTIMEAYEVYSYSIGTSVLVNSNPPAAGTLVTMEIALLVNDQVTYSAQQQQPLLLQNSKSYVNYLFTSDLVNPVRVGARERLSLRIGGALPVAVGGSVNFLTFTAASQLDPTNGNEVGFESTISYNVVDIPGRRRL